MDCPYSCSLLCQLFLDVNWLWFVIAVLAAFLLGALWYSVLFPKLWVKTFKVELPDKLAPGNMFVTMFGQIVATALMGLSLFLITPVSFWLAVLTLVGFCGFNKGMLKYKFYKWRDYFRAAGIEVTYQFLAGMVFILFALI